jgi:hypothetical protein
MTTTTKRTYKPMTPEEIMQAALERARTNHLSIIAVGKRLSDNATCYIVPSVSRGQEGMNHTVTAKGEHLECNCLAGHYDKLCMHQAYVRSYLAEQAERAASLPSEIVVLPDVLAS